MEAIEAVVLHEEEEDTAAVVEEEEEEDIAAVEEGEEIVEAMVEAGKFRRRGIIHYTNLSSVEVVLPCVVVEEVVAPVLKSECSSKCFFDGSNLKRSY